MLGQAQKAVGEFAAQILGIPRVQGVRSLPKNRHLAAIEHLNEELNEFQNSITSPGQADALIDLIYVSLRALWEMGIDAEVAFNEVHRANMDKRRGANEKRPEAGVFDAVKPSGWKGPDWDKIVGLSVVTPSEEKLHNEWGADPAPVKKGKPTIAVTSTELVASREELYGSFADRATLVDQLLDVLEADDHWAMVLTPSHRHALRMIMEKVGRIMVGSVPGYKDNWVDIAGYATLIVENK